ncbi:MAG: SDR family oxidoreductase, partial [Actinomycetota bacterium]|nr:SDR family oxidoreductase [Actinomycetota bacterium]
AAGRRGRAGGDRPVSLVSSMGVEGVADGAAPDGVDEVFAAYLRAKLAAERELLAGRRSARRCSGRAASPTTRAPAG